MVLHRSDRVPATFPLSDGSAPSLFAWHGFSLRAVPQIVRDVGIGKARRSLVSYESESSGLEVSVLSRPRTMGRMGIRRLVLVDMDRIEEHNLDRLIHAGPEDVGRYKVQLAADNLERTASQSLDELVVLPLSLRDSGAYRAIADCDIILGCADKPVARDLMNHLAVSHLIPVVEAGVALRSKRGSLHKGHIVAQIVTPDSRCLRCTKQYTTDQVSLEIEGLLENPEYISSLPEDYRPSTANVFPASLAASSQQAEMFTRLVLGPLWWPPVYQQRYHLSVASKQKDTAVCEAFCDVHARSCHGDGGDPTWLLIGAEGP